MRLTHKTKKLRAAFFWSALMLMLAGPAGISAVQGAAATAKPATQAPQPHQEEAYRYNPEGRIDPFKPFVDLEAAAKKKAEKSRVLPQNPLQRLGIGQFRLVGVIEDNKGRRAMVQDASGKFYSLVPGSYIGLNRGRVTAILKDRVIVHERVTTDEGKIESRRQVMKLRQDEVKP
ncbi:MAG: pilus assembly protein PilP [Syntrophales bacterium]|nr:pilus assembly protein PilP [Syntrophales bacterium]